MAWLERDGMLSWNFDDSLIKGLLKGNQPGILKQRLATTGNPYKTGVEKEHQHYPVLLKSGVEWTHGSVSRILDKGGVGKEVAYSHSYFTFQFLTGDTHCQGRLKSECKRCLGAISQERHGAAQ